MGIGVGAGGGAEDVESGGEGAPGAGIGAGGLGTTRVLHSGHAPQTAQPHLINHWWPFEAQKILHSFSCGEDVEVVVVFRRVVVMVVVVVVNVMVVHKELVPAPPEKLEK
uniref:Uncharacterized protein n=1 Tax=Alexandrium catenella TaxID=2925 RepID=A0A7S1RI20_ALECA